MMVHLFDVGKKRQSWVALWLLKRSPPDCKETMGAKLYKGPESHFYNNPTSDCLIKGIFRAFNKNFL